MNATRSVRMGRGEAVQEEEDTKGRGVDLLVKAGLTAAAIYLSYGLFQRKKRDPYDGLGDIVSYSSRMIAGARAVETEEGEGAIVRDPLAATLAGKQALQASRKRRVKAPVGAGRRYTIGRIAIRTKWFDDQLEMSLGMMPPSQDNAYLVDTIGGHQMPMQVVELGAGLSTRPWRMKLPANLTWYEVDRQHVLDAKEHILQSQGAEVELSSPISRKMSKNSLLESKIGSIDHHAGGVEYPLRCFSRVGVPADVRDPNWTAALNRAGFDRRKPTVWIMEGLIMYLSSEHVEKLMRDVASLSAPGSALLVVSVTDDLIEEIKSPGSRKNTGLMKEWVFGCPQDPTHWMASLGWDIRHIATRKTLAQALQYDPLLCSFDVTGDDARSSKSLFITAVPKA